MSHAYSSDNMNHSEIRSFGLYSLKSGDKFNIKVICICFNIEKMDNIAKQCDIKLVVKSTYEQLSDPSKI
jgi:hypothetical protein